MSKRQTSTTRAKQRTHSSQARKSRSSQKSAPQTPPPAKSTTPSYFALPPILTPPLNPFFLTLILFLVSRLFNIPPDEQNKLFFEALLALILVYGSQPRP